MIEEIDEVTVQASTERKNKHKKHNKTEKTSKKRITLKIKMEKGTGKSGRSYSRPFQMAEYPLNALNGTWCTTKYSEKV